MDQNMILIVSLRVFLDEINNWIGKLHKSPSLMWVGPASQMKVWIEQKDLIILAQEEIPLAQMPLS